MTTGVTSVLSLRLVAAATAAAATATPPSPRLASLARLAAFRSPRKDTRTATFSSTTRAVTKPSTASATATRGTAEASTMFAKANKTYKEASGGSSSAAIKSSPAADFKKAITLSSSPRNGSIADFCKRPLNGTPASKLFRPPPAAAAVPGSSASPLQSRSFNTSQRTMNATGASTAPGAGTGKPRVSGLASLCGKSDSFTEGPPVNAAPPALRQGTSSGVVEASESDLQACGLSMDDFDDDFDDFDIDLPSALPAKPASAAPRQPPTKSNFGFVASSPTASPTSHSAAPAQAPFPGAANDNRSASMKRASPDSNSAESPLPVAKKRSLPKNWSAAATQDTKPPSFANYAVTPLSATPAPKQSAIWETTASAVKAQKKQLKDQAKKANIGDDPKARLLEDVRSLPKPAGPVVLSNEQQHVKNLVCYKKASVFFTGPAGTGKSVLMRSIIEDLRVKYAREPEQLGVTASTGLAACNIGGMTLHSFSGIGLGKEDVAVLVRKIRQNPKAKNRWLHTKTLVIDEVSMVDGDLFDKLSQIGRTIRKNARPWGGIQLVLTGDFFQLPPVPDREKRDVKFAFEAKTWSTSIDHTIGLTEVFRQKDPEFAGMLNEMRLGKISETTIQTFKAMSRPLQFDDDLEVTELFPTRQEVENSNDRRLKALKGKSYLYEALDAGEQNLRDKLLQNMMAPKRLELRIGAQVMLIKNMDETLVNGSLGTVKKFMTEAEYESNAMQASLVDADAKKRSSILNSYLNPDGPGGAGGGGSRRPFPYVEFHGANGGTRGILVRPEEWKSELPNGVVQASRSQLPLILAWALSIHKAQGQTLDRVKVDLGRVFEKGQAYVALSRATTKHGLQVLRFEKHKVMAHPKVIEFYNNLSSAESALKNKAGDSSILAFTKKSTVNIDDKKPFNGRVGMANFKAG